MLLRTQACDHIEWENRSKSHLFCDLLLTKIKWPKQTAHLCYLINLFVVRFRKCVMLHSFLCPQRIFGSHIVIALSVRPASCPVNITYILYPNLVCGCILGCRSVAYHFGVTVILTLTSNLVFRKTCVRSISLILFEVGIPTFGVWMHLGMAECWGQFSGHCDLYLDIWPSF